MSFMNAKLTAAAIALTFSSMTVHADPEEWTADPRDPNHYYEVFAANGITWGSAKAAVVSPINLDHIGLRGYLATLTSPGEDAFVDQLRQTATMGMSPVLTKGQVWIGGSQADNQASPGDGWHWENGEGPIPGTDSATPYANWGDNNAASDVEPNDGAAGENNQENHLTLGRYGLGRGWNDEGVAIPSIGGYIVEYEIVIEAKDDPSSGQIKASSGVLKKINVIANDWVPAGVASVEVVPGSFSDGGSACVKGEAGTPCEFDTVDHRVGYTSSSSFAGTETFDYKVTDVDGAFAIATVTVDVSATESNLDPGINQLIFNQAMNPVPGGNNPLTASYQQVLNGGEVVIDCCRVLDTREGAGSGGRYGLYDPIDLDLGLAMADTVTNPTCATVPAVPAGSAILRPWQRGVPESKGIYDPPSDPVIAREHDLGVCLISSQVESRGVVFSAEQAKNVLGYKLNYSVPSIDYRPFTAGVSLDPVEVDWPFAVRWTAETDESQSGKRFSDNLMVLNLWHFREHDATKPYLSRLAAALMDSIDQVKLEGCVENNAGFLDDLKARVQSAKKDMQKNKGQDAVDTLDDATRLALLIAPYDTIGDPYGICPGNPQGLFVGRLMALKFAACSELLHATTSANSLDGACVIETDIRNALPPLPGF